MDCSPSEVCRERWGLLPRFHFPAGSQVNSSRYHLFFKHWLVPQFPYLLLQRCSITFGWVLMYLMYECWVRGTLLILMSREHSNILPAFLCCLRWKIEDCSVTAPFPTSFRQLSIVLLTIAQMYGSAPFPWTSPWGVLFRGKSQLYPPYLDLESLNDVLMEWVIFWRVVEVHMIGCLWTSTVCKDSEAIMWSYRSYLDTRSAHILISGVLFCLMR